MQPRSRMASSYRHESQPEGTGRVNKTDEDEFHAFVAPRMDRWRRSAFLLCGDWHTADDLVSVTISKLYRSWRKVRRADNRDAYAQRVLSRSWLDERRRPWKRREQVQESLPDDAWTAPDGIVHRDDLAALLRSLGPKQRAVIVLRFYLDYSVEETAKILGISTGTVKSQAARGLQTLRTLAASVPA